MKLNKSSRVALVIAFLAFLVGGATFITTDFSPEAQYLEPEKSHITTRTIKSAKSTNPSKSTSNNVETSSTSQSDPTITSSSSQTQSVTTPTASSEQITPKIAASDTEPVKTDTSGFNFGNYHFPIAPFTGTGQVPADNNVYQWTSDSRWFLIEQGGNAGAVIKANVGIGTEVTINHITYHVTDMKSGLGNTPTNSQGHDYYAAHINQHAVGFQTCDSVGVLTEWFAD